MFVHYLATLEVAVIEVYNTTLLGPFIVILVTSNAGLGGRTHALIRITSFSSVASSSLPCPCSRIVFTVSILDFNEKASEQVVRVVKLGNHRTYSRFSSSNRCSLNAAMSKSSSISLSSSEKISSSLVFVSSDSSFRKDAPERILLSIFERDRARRWLVLVVYVGKTRLKPRGH